MYNKKLKEESSQSLISLEKMNDIVDNSELEEASYSSDSTVKNSNNTSNTLSSNNTNKETSDKTKNNISKTPIGSTVQNTTKENTSNTNNVSNTENTSNNISNNTIIDNTVKEELAFKAPVSGEIIKDFAMDTLVYSNTLGEWIVHNGIDIKADKTTVVKASEAGTVKSIKNDPRYGLTVVIEHTNGFTSVYSNLLTAEFVKEGEKVEQGQTIATVGNTATFEIADEAHLHFEISKNNETLDPSQYIK